MNIIDLFRWIVLTPVVFICSVLSFGLSVFSFENLFGVKVYQNSSFVIAVASSVTVLVWLVLSYTIAPKHKMATIWISYILGSLFITLISAIVLEGSSSKSLEITSLLISSLSTGLLCCLFFQLKSNTDLNEFIEKVERNISTSNQESK